MAVAAGAEAITPLAGNSATVGMLLFTMLWLTFSVAVEKGRSDPALQDVRHSETEKMNEKNGKKGSLPS